MLRSYEFLTTKHENSLEKIKKFTNTFFPVCLALKKNNYFPKISARHALKSNAAPLQILRAGFTILIRDRKGEGERERERERGRESPRWVQADPHHVSWPYCFSLWPAVCLRTTDVVAISKSDIFLSNSFPLSFSLSLSIYLSYSIPLSVSLFPSIPLLLSFLFSPNREVVFG